MWQNVFVIVDAHSKWAEVIEMKSTTAAATITELRRLFATYGLPEQVVTDNGPQFSASEFSSFLKSNGVKHIRCVPYHPSSNGAVERFIQTFKKAIRAGGTQGTTFHQRLMSFLLVYRSTPHSTTGVAPCALFLNRDLRTRFHLLKPDVKGRVMSQQAAQKSQHDQHSRARELCVGQRVLIRNYRPGEDWVPGVIVERRDPHSYMVKVANGQVWHRHIDQLKEMKTVHKRFQKLQQTLTLKHLKQYQQSYQFHLRLTQHLVNSLVTQREIVSHLRD